MRLHNMAMGEDGKIWITGRFRKPDDQPAFCKAGSSLPVREVLPP